MVLTGSGEAAGQLDQPLASDKSLSAEDGPKPGEGRSRAAREASFCGASAACCSSATTRPAPRLEEHAALRFALED